MCVVKHLDVFAEVADGRRPRVLEVVVDPAEQQLLGRHGQQTVQALAFEQEVDQSWRQEETKGNDVMSESNIK